MFETLKSRLKNSEEGNAPCMYLDTLGYVTCGVGHLLAISGSAAELPWLMPSGLPASADAIRLEYQAVKELEPNRLLGYYMQHTTLRLAQASIDALLDQDVAAMQRGVTALVPGFASYPEPAQDALLDMAFQLGPHGLVSKFPRLIGAAVTGDWATCAEECDSNGIPQSRNEIRASLFRQAVSV